MFLYLLAFKKEPLIKVGISLDPVVRWSQLDDDRFDFSRSCLVRAKDPDLIRTLERSLKAAFVDSQRDQRDSGTPLGSDNTEIFDVQILPDVLRIIESLPRAQITLQRDLTPLVQGPPCVEADLVTREERDARRREKRRRNISRDIAENRRQFEELKTLSSVIEWEWAQVLQDDPAGYHVRLAFRLPDGHKFEDFTLNLMAAAAVPLKGRRSDNSKVDISCGFLPPLQTFPPGGPSKSSLTSASLPSSKP
jgi:hypothetical protein